jgi:hypothetical protein
MWNLKRIRRAQEEKNILKAQSCARATKSEVVMVLPGGVKVGRNNDFAAPDFRRRISGRRNSRYASLALP